MAQPTPIIITDVNGIAYTIPLATKGSEVGAPTPVVLCDVNGNAMNLAPAGVVYSNIATGIAIVTGAYATVYTTPAAGLYRVTGCIFPTTFSSTTYIAEIALNVSQQGIAQGQAYVLQQCTLSSPVSAPTSNNILLVMAANAVIQIGTFTISGTNTNCIFTTGATIERLA